jgi:hypothetical protein
MDVVRDSTAPPPKEKGKPPRDITQPPPITDKEYQELLERARGRPCSGCDD